MHPAYSVILFTTASGAGYGLLALLGIVGFNHGPSSSLWFGAVAIIIALGLITLGLLSSTFHLGRPERAWRAFSQWRSSWLSREGIASVITFAPALLFGALWLGFIAKPQWIGLAGLATAAMCAVTVFCTAKIYSTLTTIRQWHHKLTVPVYLAFALATGAVLLMAIASVFGLYQIFQAGLAVVALILTLVLKFLYWRQIDAEPRNRTIEAATGLARAGETVRQWEVPHTAKNFIMNEMGYAVARKHAEKLRRLVMILLLLAILVTVLTMAAPGLAIPLSIIAFLLAGAAAAVERWLFFAEAQHVVSLFYGAERA
ncbi:dimethyl sulfoxide reductase anchor subunit family protein [Aestuariivirga sp. YIM B02566]|uniref:Dimethyl sulfoxide reductase anchor subunit n=1 Tax=Taklimakanibacter albus TaxID=2800327 RepID=A0ACC5RAB7_9HYPH|nr:DmsC/YnfH family molybdoenzyme membrane anchor subunit [Aestuariivirga sp. YIM B02566]MBK1869333.1 dimethyl sulfoxide reductase anchor subunit [Aestuariivirga sp. YIM B02566]